MARAKKIDAAAAAAATDDDGAATAVLDPPAPAAEPDNQPFVVMVKRGTVDHNGTELIATAALPTGESWNIVYHAIDDWRLIITRADKTTDEETHREFRRAWNRLNDHWRYAALSWWESNGA